MSEHLNSAAHVRLLLCSRLALPQGSADKPLSAREWSEFERAIAAAKIEDSADLVGRTPEELSSTLGIPAADSARVASLLFRSGPLAIEVERLHARSIWVITRGDAGYPQRWLELLQDRAPVVLYGAGDRRLLANSGIAVVGSRNVTDDASAFARRVGETCARADLAVISGAARGVDRAAMTGALEGGGYAIGILADDLTRAVREPETRQWIEDQRIALVTAFHYSAPFSVGTAMARNKLIYCLAEAAVVVASEQTGGTWEGAQENFKCRWVPIFVRADEGVPSGNSALLKAGAHPIRSDQLTPEFIVTLRDAELPPLPKSAVQSTLTFE